ncbi:hypothetical protein GZD23_004098 [Salmonella enterica subsp. enterica]|nr:hypothetical protein [Salmonella enterica subsp. enterica serovar Okatie]EBI7260556.1 hypothetical protein [Salmonella enterica]EBY2986037.1 hypothetical protein [Salmonella enterica subsp. enterica serovar Durban]ECC9158286.1 hypothetical protein [Salmonella enterica subsp. salamae]ECV3919417.1 hypothetical protein [Salmonella enterica subsp. enterica serovar O rough]EEG3130350.1 hypothetical protein [Salmonella enterica subsp. enterica serovar Nima]
MKIIGVFAFLVLGRHLIRTSFLPPYGVASHRNSLYEQEFSIQRLFDQCDYSLNNSRLMSSSIASA